MVPFCASVNGIKGAIRAKYKVKAVARKGGTVRMVPGIGNGEAFAAFDVEYLNNSHAVVAIVGISEPAAVGTPAEIAQGGEFALGYFSALSAFTVGEVEPKVLVVPCEPLSIRTPTEVEFVGVGTTGELAEQFFTKNIADPYFVFAAFIAEPGYFAAIGTPGGVALVNTGAAAEVVGDAFFGRHGKYFATGRKEGALTLGGEVDAGDALGGIYALAACKVLVVMNLHGHFLYLAALGLEGVNPTAFFKHNVTLIVRGKFDVVILKVGHFLGLPGLGIVHKEIHGTVAVRNKENFVAYPHGHQVLSRMLGNAHSLFGLKVVHPNVVGHAALVVLPGTKLSKKDRKSVV